MLRSVIEETTLGSSGVLATPAVTARIRHRPVVDTGKDLIVQPNAAV